MNKHPEITLVEDVSKDVKLGVDFFKRHHETGRKFLEKFLPDELLDILEEGIAPEERDRRVKSYVMERHHAEHEDIAKRVEAVKEDWKQVEEQYFRLVDKVFKGHPWPPGPYVGCATVFYSYPRNLRERTFYFPYRHRKPHYANLVIAHEVLHFMFFDYAEKKYGTDWKSAPPLGYLWKVSEAFNTTMERWEPYRKIFLHGGKPYSNTKEIAEKMDVQWKLRQDVDELLDQWLK
ncbi:MAG: hypothetical protein V1656_01900 [Candidatus Jorgensenbacteria bacterium]